MNTITTFEEFVAWSNKLPRFIKRPRAIAVRNVEGEQEQFTNRKGECLVAEAGKHLVCYNVKKGQAVDPYPMTNEALSENWSATEKRVDGMVVYEGKGIQAKVLVTTEFYNANIDIFNQYVDAAWKSTTSVANSDDPVFVKDKVATTEAGSDKYQDITRYGYLVVNFSKEGFIYDVYPNDGCTYYFINDPMGLIDYIKRT